MNRNVFPKTLTRTSRKFQIPKDKSQLNFQRGADVTNQGKVELLFVPAQNIVIKWIMNRISKYSCPRNKNLNLKRLKAGCSLVFFLVTAGNSFAQVTWRAYESNPVIKMADLLAGAQWNDPAVLKENTGYSMYLTANLAGQGENVVPFRATSSDGINWDINTTPLLSPGRNVSDFDHAKIETPSVVFFNNQYHLYYTGVQTDLSSPLSIGYATSVDGISWIKDSKNPVLAPTGDFNDWNGAQVAEPGAVVMDSSIYVYFTAVGLRNAGNGPFAKGTIGLAVSADGSSFAPPVLVLEQGARYPASENFEGYSTPHALVLDSAVHLYYDVAQIQESENPSWVQVALHHAVSPDGFIWTEDEEPIFVRSDFGWTKREIRAPTVIQDGDSLKMWFAGDDFLASGIWGVGYATASLNLTSVKDRVSGIPSLFQLSQNYPNPFNPETTIRYQLPKAGQVTLTIYNTLGKGVRTLVNQKQTVGSYSVVWNGKNDTGELATSGMYFYKLKIGDSFIATRKMLLLK